MNTIRSPRGAMSVMTIQTLTFRTCSIALVGLAGLVLGVVLGPGAPVAGGFLLGVGLVAGAVLFSAALPRDRSRRVFTPAARRAHQDAWRSGVRTDQLRATAVEIGDVAELVREVARNAWLNPALGVEVLDQGAARLEEAILVLEQARAELRTTQAHAALTGDLG